MSNFASDGISSADKASLESAKGSVVNFVTDCGADPTGATDCAAAFDAAFVLLSAVKVNHSPAQSCKLFIPPGRYSLRGALAIPTWNFNALNSSLAIQGAGIDNTILELNGVDPPAIANVYSCELADFTMLGNSAGSANDCIFGWLIEVVARLSLVRRINVFNVKAQYSAVRSYGASGISRFEECLVTCSSSQTDNYGVFTIDAFVNAQVEGCVFTDVGRMNGINENGTKIGGCRTWLQITSTAGVAGPYANVSVKNCYFDENVYRNIYVKGEVANPIRQVFIENVFLNPPVQPGQLVAIQVDYASTLKLDGVVDSGLNHTSTSGFLSLVGCGNARLIGLNVDATSPSNFVTADGACGYIEVEGSPTMSVPNIQSSATRTVVKNAGGTEDLFTANGTIAAHQLCKNVTGGVVVILTTDVIDVVRGAASAAATATQKVALSRFSTPTTFLSDGTATIAIGDRLGISPSSAGRVRTVSAAIDSVGVATGTTAASADALVAAYFEPEPARSLYFSLDVTLVAGTKTLASGKDLTNATLVNVRLKTPTTATGDPVVTFVAGANGNVTVTSYTAGAIQTATDASTYTCVFSGAV